MQTSSPVIGIDFGTSNSKMAWYNPKTKQAEIIQNADGKDQTPSVVYFGQDEILVGTSAVEMLEYEQERERVIFSVKRELITTPLLALPDKALKPVEVAAEILRKLRRDAQEQHFQEEVTRAVITYPASFGPQERDKIHDAAVLAGFREIKMLEEPVAAALAYTQMGLNVGKCVLVYDLGGGTFDLAVLTSEDEGAFQLALEPSGLKRCGGDDFDAALYNHCNQVAQEKLGRAISQNGKRDLHFLQQCRQRKENLSKTERPMLFKSLLESGFQCEINRATFEDLIRMTVEETVRKTEALMKQAREAGHVVDTLVLIGGSSRVPLVQQLLEQHLTLKPLAWQKRDAAVALGAAYYAQSAFGANPSEQYRSAVGEAWANQILDQEKIQRLTALAKELAVSNEQAAQIEREVMGDTKEHIVTRTSALGLVQRQLERQCLDQYRREVETAWANKKLSSEKITRLKDLANRLGLKKEQTAPIEREVMGDIKGRTLQQQEEILQYQKQDQYGKARISQSAPTPTKLVQPPSPAPLSIEKLVVLRTLRGHTEYVTSVALSGDGQTLVSGSGDHTIKVWNPFTGRLLGTLQGHTNAVWSVALSGDGQTLVSGSIDETIKMWNLSTGQLLDTLQGHTGAVWSVALSGDGQTLVSGSNDETIKVWNLSTGQCVRTLQGHTGGVSGMALSGDGQTLVSGSWDKTIKVWNLSTCQCVRTLQGHTGGVSSVALSGDGQTLVSGGIGKLKVWNLSTGQLLHNLWGHGHTRIVWSVALSGDGQTLVSAGGDKTIKVWNLSTGQLLRTLQGHTKDVRSVALSGDGQTLVSGSSDKTIKVWGA